MTINCKTPDACRIKHGPGYTTDMYFPPVYDGHGNNLNPDSNVTSGNAECSTCGKKWMYSVICGMTSYKELI